MKIVSRFGFILLTIVMLSACESTGLYQEAQKQNDFTFKMSLQRLCGPLADFSAQRNLTPAEYKARATLCTEFRKRQLSE